MSFLRTATPRITHVVVAAPQLSRVAPAIARFQVSRPFATTPTSLVKKDKGGKGGKGGKKGSYSFAGTFSSSSEGSDGDHPAADPADPADFADVESRWDRTEAHYIDVLKQFKSGGSFNPDTLGTLPVSIKATGGNKKVTTYPLRELAQVVPRTGRTVSLIAFERDSIKPIMSAVQNSPDFNQQPQINPDNELELVMKIEAVPVDMQLKKLGELCHAWREQVRNIRTKREKTIQGWQKEKKVLPDVSKTVSAELLKVMHKRVKTVDTAETQAAAEIKRKS